MINEKYKLGNKCTHMKIFPKSTEAKVKVLREPHIMSSLGSEAKEPGVCTRPRPHSLWDADK